MFSTLKSTNEMDLLVAIKDVLTLKQTNKYEKIYGINMWFNFFILDLFNFNTKHICIANQFSVPDYRMDMLIRFSKFFSCVVPVSVHLPSKHTKYVIPPLVEIRKINRQINKKLILAYSVSGQNFSNTLIMLAKKNPSYEFRYFTYIKPTKLITTNIKIFKPDKKNFSKFFEMCGAVLCTSGDTLPMECAFNAIPVAIMSCSDKHFEQNFNIHKYVFKFKYALLMHNDLNLNFLVDRDMSKISSNIKSELKFRNKKILKLCNI